MKFELSKSMVTCSHQDDYVSLTIADPVSGIQFADLEISFAAFGKLLAGSGTVTCTGELRGLQHIGKVRISEKRSVKLPDDIGYTREKAEAYINDNLQEDGWIVKAYLGSQGSIINKFNPSEKWANYFVYKYVDPVEVTDA